MLNQELINNIKNKEVLLLIPCYLDGRTSNNIFNYIRRNYKDVYKFYLDKCSSNSKDELVGKFFCIKCNNIKFVFMCIGLKEPVSARDCDYNGIENSMSCICDYVDSSDNSYVILLHQSIFNFVDNVDKDEIIGLIECYFDDIGWNVATIDISDKINLIK